MAVEIVPMSLADYDAVVALWRETEGLGLSEADSEESIGRYLERNPGMSFVAREDGRIVGAALCGHDGRRAYLHHLAVAVSHRRRGLGTLLTKACLEAVRADGIRKCHLFLLRANTAGRAFWKRIGWTEREDLRLMSANV